MVAAAVRARLGAILICFNLLVLTSGRGALLLTYLLAGQFKGGTHNLKRKPGTVSVRFIRCSSQWGHDACCA